MARTPSISEAFAALGSGVVCVSSMAPVRLGIAPLLSRCQPSKAFGCRCCFAACFAPQLLSVSVQCLSSVCPPAVVQCIPYCSLAASVSLESVPAACRATLARCACLYLRHLTIRGACVPVPSRLSVPPPTGLAAALRHLAGAKRASPFHPASVPSPATPPRHHPSTVTPPGTALASQPGVRARRSSAVGIDRSLPCNNR